MDQKKDEKLFTEFPAVTTAEWEAKIREDLKGADYEKKLVWKTIEGFNVRPYYRADNLDTLSYLNQNPGKFPSAVTANGPDGKPQTSIQPVDVGSDVQSIFFDMWRQDHADEDLQNLPGDLVTTSGSGLDPHITLQNAQYQMDRVSAKWATDLKRDPASVRSEIEQILMESVSAPFGGLIGEKIVNVLQVNLALRTKYGAPQ